MILNLYGARIRPHTGSRQIVVSPEVSNFGILALESLTGENKMVLGDSFFPPSLKRSFERVFSQIQLVEKQLQKNHSNVISCHLALVLWFHLIRLQV